MLDPMTVETAEIPGAEASAVVAGAANATMRPIATRVMYWFLLCAFAILDDAYFDLSGIGRS
jgi:hypothetical protein